MRLEAQSHSLSFSAQSCALQPHRAPADLHQSRGVDCQRRGERLLLWAAPKIKKCWRNVYMTRWTNISETFPVVLDSLQLSKHTSGVSKMNELGSYVNVPVLTNPARGLPHHKHTFHVLYQQLNLLPCGLLFLVSCTPAGKIAVNTSKL